MLSVNLAPRRQPRRLSTPRSSARRVTTITLVSLLVLSTIAYISTFSVFLARSRQDAVDDDDDDDDYANGLVAGTCDPPCPLSTDPCLKYSCSYDNHCIINYDTVTCTDNAYLVQFVFSNSTSGGSSPCNGTEDAQMFAEQLVVQTSGNTGIPQTSIAIVRAECQS